MKLKYIITPSLLVLGLAAGLTACSPKDTKTAVVEAVVQKPELGSFGIATNYIDDTVKPGDNFFKYVNGGWIKNTEIPADKSNYGSFTVLADRSETQVKAIIEDASNTRSKMGTPEQKIGDLYAAFMDTDAIDAAGIGAISDDLAKINELKDHSAVATLMGDPSMSLNSIVGGWVTVDSKDIEHNIFYMTQSGLGMPNRGYYLDEDDKSVGLRAKYMTFLKAMLSASGADDVDARASAVMAFETEIAKTHWAPTKRRNRDLTYNKMTMAELIDYAPGFDWQATADASGVGAQKAFVIRETDALQGSAKVFADTPLNVIKDYLTAHYISANSAYLPSAIDAESFAFYGQALRGTKEQRARWKRGVRQVSGTLGEMIGQVYVKRHFKPAAKSQMDALVVNLRSAFKDGIDNLEWMGAETKVEAQDKLAKFYPKIGYPKKWIDYSSMNIDRNDLIGTIKSSNVWAWNEMISELGKPIDREKWGMTPQTVNAYYNPGLNEIVFPAAILQAPFFDPNADAAVNYGGIGAVIGHEMGHGFDDQGSKSDGNGQQRDWWTESDKAAFKVKTNALVAQYAAFEPLEGLFVNGELTLGENIGDLTGITMAYAAYKKSLGGKEDKIIDGFTGDQRFFMSYGQIWQRKFRDEALRNRIKTDPHSPGEYRANGIVRNFDPWYAAFNVQPGDALYLAPEDRVKIW
ncbi:MAG: M13 family metallopeptidase [Robiginitomaculum sp.]|nr:M13 family metallopeptidase [Robiginitomaculum sp.]